MTKKLDKKKIADQVANILFDIDAVAFRFNPPFVFTTGIKSPIYLDNRMIMSHPKQRRKIIEFYISVIKEEIGIENIDAISGTASSAIPLGAWIAEKLNLPLVYVRPTSKSYGKGNKLEGNFKKGSKVLVIEDHVSTASSLINNAQTVREVGGKVRYCMATTTYESKQSINLLKENKIHLITLTTGRKIVEKALHKNLLTEKEKKSINLWFQDPLNWSKKV